MKNGILLINKPKGLTSRDVVNIVCKKLNTKKVGHTGTLDPLATGLLIICVNKATGLTELITSEDKEYIASVKLGIKTDTLDITGNVLEQNENYCISFDELNKTLMSFLGSYLQEVPLYSAIKIDGKRLYDYAREGKSVLLPKREVTINEIELLELNNDSFTFRVNVSKGTYIRSLIRDIGNKMNILMTMTELKRTKIDDYDIIDAKNIDNFDEHDIISPENFFKFPRVYVDNDLEKKILNGVRIKNIYNSEIIMFFNKNNKLLAIYKNNEKNELCMYKLF